MNERYKNGYESFAVIFKRGANRAYFIVASPQHKNLLRQRLVKMSYAPWNRHFDATLDLTRETDIEICNSVAVEALHLLDRMEEEDERNLPS